MQRFSPRTEDGRKAIRDLRGFAISANANTHDARKKKQRDGVLDDFAWDG
jgi:hypothetical protein